MLCEEQGCDRVRTKRQYCQMHYARRARRGDFATKGCLIEDCAGSAYTRGLCSAHYQNASARKRGVAPRKRGEFGAWRKHPSGYVLRHKYDAETRQRITQRQHRVAMEAHLGRFLLPHEEVHHANGQRDDNRLSNLELWSTKQPKGQRVEDKVEFALEILALYAPERLAQFDLAA